MSPGAPGQAVPSPPEGAKVHGTITVDFEKVTIAELLKLVSAIEKVDGVIRIVSSADRNGEPAMVVGGGQGTLTLAKPELPNIPRLVVESASRPQPQSDLQVHEAQPFARRGMAEIPGLAALGRLLGVGKPARGPVGLRAAAPDPTRDRHASALPRDPQSGREPSKLETPGINWGPDRRLGLTAGDHIGSLASGVPTISGPVRSPWPAQSTGPSVTTPAYDQQVMRADHEAEPAPKPSLQKHVTAEGETFEALAQRFYGDSRYAWALWWSNRDSVAWPDALTPGKPISIPALGQLDPKMVMTEAQAPAEASTASRRIGPRRDPELIRASHTEPGSESAQKSADGGGFAVHVVRPEDTLRIIARQKCGDERKALEIIALNRDVLTPEGRPRVGQRLILPSPTAPQAP